MRPLPLAFIDHRGHSMFTGMAISPITRTDNFNDLTTSKKRDILNFLGTECRCLADSTGSPAKRDRIQHGAMSGLKY